MISPSKHNITFAFSKGAQFEDEYGLLRGVGHVSKHIKLAAVDQVPEEALVYYINQALRLDT